MLVTSVTGLGVALYLGIEKKGIATSFCSVSEVCDCGAVNSSPQSELFGIPIALLGAAFYAGVAVLSLVVIRGANSDRTPFAAHLIGLGGLIGVAYSVFLAMVSMELGKWCLLCVSLYGVNLILLLNAQGLIKGSDAGLIRGGLRALRGQDGRSANVMGVASAVTLISTLVWYGSGGGAPAVDGPADLSKLFVATEGPLELDGTEPIYGNPSAPYLVVEFADFECPACAATFDPLHEVVSASPDVQLRFKHYPLSGVCNEGIEGDRHANSCPAAVAADCAGAQGKFWELTRLMFKNQRFLGGGGIETIASQVHMDMAKFRTCIARPSADVGVRADVEAARTVGVHATPSLYLKGIKGDEWVLVRGGTPGLEALLDAHRTGVAMPPTPKAEPHSH
jgi:protein-disulfide isomerase/uncharacterized membrane protein